METRCYIRDGEADHDRYKNGDIFETVQCPLPIRSVAVSPCVSNGKLNVRTRGKRTGDRLLAKTLRSS